MLAFEAVVTPFRRHHEYIRPARPSTRTWLQDSCGNDVPNSVWVRSLNVLSLPRSRPAASPSENERLPTDPHQPGDADGMLAVESRPMHRHREVGAVGQERIDQRGRHRGAGRGARRRACDGKLGVHDLAGAHAGIGAGNIEEGCAVDGRKSSHIRRAGCAWLGTNDSPANATSAAAIDERNAALIAPARSDLIKVHMVSPLILLRTGFSSARRRRRRRRSES